MLRDTPSTVYLKDYLPPEFLIDQVMLWFDLDETETRVRSRLELRRNPAAQSRSPDLRLHGEQLELISLSLDGQPVAPAGYLQDDEGLTVRQVPDQFVLESEVRILPQQNTALEGLYKSGGLFCTQCEAEGFRKITWYLDRPDVMSRFTTTICADKQRYPVLLSNGNPSDTVELEDGRHRITWTDPFPKPAYLFALVAGDLRAIEDSHTTPSGREVTLRIYVEPENIDKCDHAMASLKRAMAWDEQQYGREYDLDIYMIVAVNDFNMGAMENKGLNIFNSKFVLASPATATDRDFQGIESVIAHEYFHNWTGNRITCRDWFQLSLKEGLTVFRDQEFSADMGSRGVKRIEDVRLLRAHQFAEDAGPMAHPVRPDSYMEINNFYTVTVYEKGAEVVRMQANLLGPEAFRGGTDLYFERFDGQAVTTDDFVQCMADAGQRDLGQFKRWYSQAGTPELTIQGVYDAAQQTYTLTVEQHCPATPGQPDKEPFLIPLAVGLLDDRGTDLALRLAGDSDPGPTTRMLEISEPRQQFVFEQVPVAPVPSLLRGFSAPVKVRFDYSNEQLMFLMAHDSDGFSRWDAAQTLAQRILLQLVDDPDSLVPEGFVQAFRQALQDSASDPALLAEVLTLPAESYLGDQMAEVDVEGIHRAREQLKTLLASELKTELLAVYRDNEVTGEYRPDADAIGRRSLRNLALGYLMQLEDQAIQALCIAQYRAGNNMTDVITALSLLADRDIPETAELLEGFYQQWRDDPLVLDKWFSLQAMSKRPDTLERVKGLLDHPAFSIANPNKVRSLIGAFCSGNPVRFHAADGAGYRFLSDRVLELDQLNPQVAARMVRLMTRWQRYDPARQRLMQTQLERILHTSGVSRDVYEIVSKSLEHA
ncbi:aminopeptidase N [Sedimenticola thiotaurini]|uniref:Aminopeptidase N n=1 Tax=Sedimenticola thiotaurini TaxID=1543721 RepID=A0A0F7K1S2_9GAMM|nr:aminopeptidase N [Sedimenticola thiotaurini]AKH21822.1 aminopeptidase N [Sedimenticola thiotaurini]